MMPNEFVREFQKAVDALMEGNHEVASRILDPLSKCAPRFVPLINNVGVSHYQRYCVSGDPQALAKARQVFEYAVLIDPHSAEALSNLGNILDDYGDYAKAEEVLRRAVATHPDCTDALCNLGMVLHRQDRLEEAIQFYKQAIRADPAHANAWCNLGEALRELRRFSDAMQATLRVLEIQPNHPQATTNKTRLERLLRQGHPAAGEAVSIPMPNDKGNEVVLTDWHGMVTGFIAAEIDENGVATEGYRHLDNDLWHQKVRAYLLSKDRRTAALIGVASDANELIEKALVTLPRVLTRLHQLIWRATAADPSTGNVIRVCDPDLNE